MNIKDVIQEVLALASQEIQKNQILVECEFTKTPTLVLADRDLLDAVHIALERDRARRQRESESTELQQWFDSLTSREREVILLVVAGKLNKEIAHQLGTAKNTI